MNRAVVIAAGVATLVGASILGWVEVQQARDFRRLIIAGDSALARDQTYAAIEAFSGALALRRDAMLPWLKRGETYRRRGEFGNAVRDLDQATALDPTALQPRELLGDVAASIGRHTEAATHYTRYLAIDDRAPRVLYKLALAHYRDGRPADAIEPLRRAVALEPRLVEAHHLLGLALRDTGHAEPAAASLARALDLNAAYAPARDDLAAIHTRRGDHRQRIEQLEALAALEPLRPQRLVAVGDAYAASGRIDAAVLTLGRAAERYPQSTAPYLALARVWLDIAEDGDSVARQKALEALDTASARGDTSAEQLTLRGRVFLLAGDARAAERVLTEATTRTPVDPEAFRYLADAAHRLGREGVVATARAKHAVLTAR